MPVYLRKVTIENFRGFNKLEIELDETTILIGENNCGKSSILEAIRLSLSRLVSRRSSPFDDQDYHLASASANPGDAGALRIILDFAENKPNEWNPDFIRALAEAISFDGNGLNHVTFSVTSTFDRAAKDFVTDWEFLDGAGIPNPRAKRSSVLGTLQNLISVYYLNAFRDATRDFSPRSSFWGPFLRNPDIPDTIKTQLEAELSALNAKIVASEQRLKKVSTNLEKAQKIVSLGQKDTVSIEAIPSRIWDMLSRAQVNIAAVTGASLPLLRHGAGTQSLASIFLFESFLAAGVNKADPLTSYILQIEEPEAHLHPSAIRSLWPTLSASSEQKIIATHSGDLLSEVPLGSIRRLRRTKTGVEVRRFDLAAFTQEETRKIKFHVRRHRGELLFARVWLLHEGETEYWILSEAARTCGISLEQAGVRLVEYSNVGPTPLLKLADQFGIEWLCLCDGDQQGKSNARAATALLGGRSPADHISEFPEPDIEHHLCAYGLGAVYHANMVPAKVATISVPATDPAYWAQVLSAQPKKFKVECALRVVEIFEQQGPSSVPLFIKNLLKRSVSLGGV